MSSIKKSVMLSDLTQSYIASRTRREEDFDEENMQYSWSKCINGATSTLVWMLDKALPELTEFEWQCVLNVFNGTMWDDDRIESFLSLASRMMDDIGAFDINTVEPELQAVIRRVHGFSVIEQYAVADMARKFWAKPQEADSLLAIIEKLRGV